MFKNGIIAALILVFALATASQADTATLIASKDNTLYENAGGSLSNGAGNGIFAGNTASGAKRRGLLAFNLTGVVPANATIESVSLSLFMSQTNGGSGTSVGLHRVLADWGEGASVAGGGGGGGATAETGDATWLHRFSASALWTNAGGDFSTTTSASLTIGDPGQTYTWSSPQLISDVELWLANPDQNFGWLLQGDESRGATAMRFDSRESGTLSQRPQLTIVFTPAISATAPEPASGALWACGAILAGVALRRRKS